ncbi:MAG: hypothetical protein WD894_10585 [Pirellulales bacterium]
MISLRWIASPLASALYACDALRRRLSFVDPRLAEALREPAGRLVRAIGTSDLPVERLWANLLPTAATHEHDTARHLIDVAVLKVVARHQIHANLDHFADRLMAFERAFLAAVPNAVEELELRARPLREQWDARGPGLLTAVGEFTEPGLIVPQGSVGMVHPVLGGGGSAYPDFNAIIWEAVLTNPVPQLPEAVRLGWLLSQLNLELPRYQGDLQRERSIELGSWAMLPAVLAAAEQLELVRFDEATMRLAVKSWRIHVPRSSAFVHDLMSWWQTFQADRPPWTVAITALDMLIATEEGEMV